MANLKIEVTGSVRSGSSATPGTSSGGAANAQAVQAEAAALKQVEALLNRTSTLYQQINADAAKALGAAVATAEKSAQAMVTLADRGARARQEGEQRVTQTVQSESAKRLAGIQSEFSKLTGLIALSLKQREDAAKKAADAEIREAERAAAAQRRAAALRGVITGGRQIGGGIASGASTAIQGVQQAAGTLSAGAGAGFSQAISGRLLSGDIFRGIGTVVSAAARAGGQLGSALVGGLGQAVSGGLSGLGSIIGSAFGPVGSVVSGVLGRTLGGVAGVVSKALGAAFSIAGELGGVLGSAAGEIAGFIGDKLGLALKITAGAAIAAAFVGIRNAARAEDVTPAFEKLAQVTGETVVSALEKLRATTKGTISDLELMKNANRAVALGAASNVDEFGKLAETARQLGKTVGVDVGYALESMVLGIGRLSPRILDNLGLQVKLEQVNEDYARGLGKTAEALTTTEQRAALLAEVMKQANARLEGVQLERTSDKFDRFGSTVSNLSTSLGKALLPAIGTLADIASDAGTALDKFLNNNRETIANKLTQAVSGLGTTVKNVLDGLKNESLGSLFEKGLGAARGLWIEFKAEALKAIEVVSNRAKEIFENLREDAADAVPFGRFDIKKPFAGKEEASQIERANLAERQATRRTDVEERIKNIDAQRDRDLAANTAATEANTRAILQQAGEVGPPSSLFPQQSNLRPIGLQQAPVPVVVQAPGGTALGSFGGGTGGGAPASPAATAATASVGELLKKLIPSDAVAAVESYIASMKLTAEQAGELQKVIAEQVASASNDAAIKRVVQAREQRLAQEESDLRILQDKESDLRKTEQKLADERKGLAQKRIEVEKEIAGKFEQALREVTIQAVQLIQSINAKVQSTVQGLKGIAGGEEAQGGLPLTIVKAIRLRRRDAEKSRFEGIRDDPEFAGASARNLADDPERLNRILTRQARRETGADDAEAAIGEQRRIREKRLDDARNEIENKLGSADSPAQLDLAKQFADAAISLEQFRAKLDELANGPADQTKGEKAQTDAANAGLAGELIGLQKQASEQAAKAAEGFAAQFEQFAKEDTELRRATAEGLRNLTTAVANKAAELEATRKEIEEIKRSIAAIDRAARRL